MKLLAVSHEASRTGAVRAFVDAVESLRSLTSDLTVITKTDGPLVREMSELSSHILVVPKRRVARLGRLARLKHFDWVPPLVERYVAEAVLRELRPDMVYVSTVLSSEYAAAAQRLSIPCLLHVHEQQPLTSWALRRSGTRAVGLATIAPSPFIAHELEMLGSRVAVLPGPVRLTGINMTLDEPSPWSRDAHKLLICGTVAPWKGSELVLDMAELLPSLDGQDVEWVWLGAGDTVALSLETARRGLEHRVCFIGERPNPRPFMADADILVMPSSQESFGLVALEAAAAGTPTVAFSVGGLTNILRHPGALAPPHDKHALVEKVMDVLRDHQLRRALLQASATAVAESELTTWGHNVADAVDAVYLGHEHVRKNIQPAA